MLHSSQYYKPLKLKNNHRAKAISFKDKLIKYPRIILGVQHSPLQPNNCPEMGFIIGKAKIVRDSCPVEKILFPLVSQWLLNPTLAKNEQLKLAKKFKKPYLVMDLSKRGEPRIVEEWGQQNRIRILNVAGPRESKVPGIHDKAVEFLRETFRRGSS